MKKLNLLFCLAGIGLIALMPSMRAQDAHYWTFQYGPKSSLLGGAVIGTINDISGTYYNPGSLSLSDNLAFAISVDVLELTKVSLEGGGGPGVDLGTSKSGLRPSLIAGTFKKKLFGKGVMGYSAITRARGQQNLQGMILLGPDEIPPDVDLEQLFGLSRFEGRYNDFWLGFSYSHPIGKHIGLGVTLYGASRSQSRRVETIIEGVLPDSTGTVSIDIRGGNYSTLRTLAKFGGYAEFGPISLGLTLTTPSLHLSGKGELGLHVGKFGSDTVAMSTSIQTNLPAEYKSPLSIGAGIGIRLGAARVHASAEWFQEIQPYVVIQGEPFESQVPAGEIIPVDAVQALDEVINWGLGLEYAFSPTLHGYLSYNTDRSGLTKKIERAGLSTSPIDINNVNLGADFNVGKILFTVGLGYGWGRKLDQQLTDLLQREDEDFQATFVYQSFRLLFGFELARSNKKE